MGDNEPNKSLVERSRRRSRKKMLFRINIALAAAAVLLLAAVLIKSCGGNSSSQELLANTDTFYAGIYIEDIDVGGLTKEEAKKKILAKLEDSNPWTMQVIYGDRSYQVEDIVSENLDEILDGAFMLGRTGEDKDRLNVIKQMKKDHISCTVDKAYEEAELDAVVKKAAEAFNTSMENADLTGYDSEKKEFLYSEGVTGYELDQEALKKEIAAAIDERRYNASIEAVMNVVEPQMDRAEVKEKVQLIGRFTTTTTNNSDRNENIRLASGAINQIVIKPGETFSMNETTGERTLARGYKPAGTIVNGKLVEEPGGGVCQVSTTLYNAVVMAGLKTTERFSHSLEPSYVTPGEDAMVSFPSADLKFENNGTSSIVILFEFYNNQLTASIYGIPVLEEGVTVEMYSETEQILSMPEPEYIEDETLGYGEEVVVTKGRDGNKVVTYLITKKDGVQISKERFHTSVYQPKTPVIRRNSKAVEPTESEEPKESEMPEGTDEPEAAETPKPARTPEPVITPTPVPVITPEPEEPSDGQAADDSDTGTGEEE